MRQLFVVAALVAAVGVLQAAAPQGDLKCQVNGLHLCCKQCENSVRQILGKVEGISNVECDRKEKSVAFTAKDDKAANKAISALADGGFAITSGSIGDIGFATGGSTGAGTKFLNEVTVTGVHACCNQCNAAIKALFKDAEVTITGKGAQKDVRVSGKDLDTVLVLSKLRQGGFNGKIVEKK
jgi:copper chaperone CopZ